MVPKSVSAEGGRLKREGRIQEIMNGRKLVFYRQDKMIIPAKFILTSPFKHRLGSTMFQSVQEVRDKRLRTTNNKV